MDITSLFKARLEHVRNRNKALGTIQSGGDGIGTTNNKSSAKSKIFPGKKSEYHSKTREICTTITSLRDFLQENRSAYLNVSASRSYGKTFSETNYVSSSQPTMTDTERDQIDSSVQKIIQNCQKKIFDFERLVQTTNSIQNQPQLSGHLENVVSSLADYLKNVCTSYSEMRAIRVKRTVDLQAMSRLMAPVPANKKQKLNSNSETSKKGGDKNSTVPLSEVDGSTSGIATIPSYFLPDEISPEEMQLLEEENVQLLNQLNSLSDEVAQIETNVIQIAQLQEIFTEKVLQQEKDIDKIANVVVSTTENIRSGNEQIRQAIQKNADFRAWVLFFIIVMSFSLLFLDWYND